MRRDFCVSDEMKSDQKELLFLSVDEFVIGHIKYFTQRLQFNVCNISFVCLDPCDHVFVHVISVQLKMIGKKPLREMISFPQCDQIFADQIFLSCL